MRYCIQMCTRTFDAGYGMAIDTGMQLPGIYISPCILLYFHSLTYLVIFRQCNKLSHLFILFCSSFQCYSSTSRGGQWKCCKYCCSLTAPGALDQLRLQCRVSHILPVSAWVILQVSSFFPPSEKENPGGGTGCAELPLGVNMPVWCHCESLYSQSPHSCLAPSVPETDSRFHYSPDPEDQALTAFVLLLRPFSI